MAFPPKDPNAVLDYEWDFGPWLLPFTDTISSHSVFITSGDVVVNSSSHTTTTVTAWLSGGTVDTDAEVTARVTTAQGRSDDRTIRLEVRQR